MTEQSERQVDKELTAAGFLQGHTEQQKTDHQIGERLQRNAEHALTAHGVVDRGLAGRRWKALDRPRHDVGDHRITAGHADDQRQRPAAGPAHRLHRQPPQYETHHRGGLRRGVFPAVVENALGVIHKVAAGPHGQQKQQHVVPGHPSAVATGKRGPHDEHQRHHQRHHGVEKLALHRRDQTEKPQVQNIIEGQNGENQGRQARQPGPEAL